LAFAAASILPILRTFPTPSTAAADFDSAPREKLPIRNSKGYVVSNKGPKDKNTDKIKFFKVEPAGGVSPAFPKGQTQSRVDLNPEHTHAGKEPVFTNDPDERSRSMPEADPRLDETPLSPPDGLTSEQWQNIREQVEDIPLAGSQNLSSDQTDVLKRYISLKEAEVRDFRDQHRQYRSYLKKLSKEVESLTSRNRELLGEIEVLRRRDESARNVETDLKRKFEDDLILMKNEFEERLRRSGDYESQVEELVQKREEWREKVKEDLKRIKLKERELENKYELLKRDAQALLDSKDKHTLELKKKSDALELEMESLEDRLRTAKSTLGAIDSKKKRLIETLKLAISLLENIDQSEASSFEKDRKTG